MKSKKGKPGVNWALLLGGGLTLLVLVVSLILAVNRVGNLQDVLQRPKAYDAGCLEVCTSEFARCNADNKSNDDCRARCQAQPTGQGTCFATCGFTKDCSYNKSTCTSKCARPTPPPSATGVTCWNLINNKCVSSGGQSNCRDFDYSSESACRKNIKAASSGGGDNSASNTGSSGATSACADCILRNRGDVVSFYAGNDSWKDRSNADKVDNWCGGGVSSGATADCKKMVDSACKNECGGVSFGGGGGGGSSGGGGGSGSSASNSSAGETTTACFNNCFKNVKPGNGSYCKSFCANGGSPTAKANSCFDNCFTKIKPGNGTYCKNYCATNGNGVCFDNCFKNIKPGNGTYCTSYCSNQNVTHMECVSNSCKKIAGAGSDQCTGEGTSCTISSEANACWGNSGINGKCYDCNGDGTINILDFSCFAKHWLENVL